MNPRKQLFLFAAALISTAFALLLGLPGAAEAAAPKADLWPRWKAHDPQSTLRVDHAEWARFLKKYVRQAPDGVNRVAYKAITPEDRKSLDAYVDRLAAVPVSRLRRAEQFPYWVNLYNALTVQVILDHFPVSSILRVTISPGWFSIGPWGKKLLTIEGERVSLDDIEHRILRPIWRDPRIHYAVNCASVGCPNLALVPYTAETMEKMLNEGAKAYVNHPRAAKWTRWGLVVSSLYEWYQVDFGGTDTGVIAHLKKYASPELEQKLEKISNIYNHEYSWDLNIDSAELTSEKTN